MLHGYMLQTGCHEGWGRINADKMSFESDREKNSVGKDRYIKKKGRHPDDQSSNFKNLIP